MPGESHVTLPSWVVRWVLPLVLPVGLSSGVSGAGYLATHSALAEQVQDHERLSGHPIIEARVARIEADFSALRHRVDVDRAANAAEDRALRDLLGEVRENQRAICLALEVDCRPYR